MTINLFDIPTATAAYIDNEVDVEIRRITGNLESSEDGTYTVRVTNPPAPRGVKLSDISLHLTVSPGSVAQLLAPGSALLNPQATNNADGPRLSRDEEVDEMFVFFAATDSDNDLVLDGTLDVGEQFDLELGYRAMAAGDATISCHVHASVDVDDLFPRSGGTPGDGAVRILRSR